TGCDASADSPSIVVIFFPATLEIGVMQEREAWPLMCTVQAPQSAIPQPNLVPVMFSVSRSTHSSGICGSVSTVLDSPFSVNVIAMVNPLASKISYTKPPHGWKYTKKRHRPVTLPETSLSHCPGCELPQCPSNCYHYQPLGKPQHFPVFFSKRREVARVESTRNLVLSQFPQKEHANRSLQKLADLLEVFSRAGTLHARLDALVDLYSWLRLADHRLPELRSESISGVWPGAAWRRQHVWLSILDASPELRDRFHAG